MKLNKKSFLEKYGPWALVAGASEGLGAAYARALAGRGMNLVLIARRRELLRTLADSLKKEHRIDVMILSLDLADPESFHVIEKKTAGLDIGLLVYNAALSLIGLFYSHSLEEHLKEIDINCRGPLSLTYAFGNRFAGRGGGGIILMSSLSSSQGSPYVAGYAATKAWNRIFAEGLWYELRPAGVDVLVCTAGVIDTPNYRASASRLTMKGMRPDAIAQTALKDIGRKPVSIPGFGNRAVDFLIRRLLPVKARIKIMGDTLKRMYS